MIRVIKFKIKTNQMIRPWIRLIDNKTTPTQIQTISWLELPVRLSMNTSHFYICNLKCVVDRNGKKKNELTSSRSINTSCINKLKYARMTLCNVYINDFNDNYVYLLLKEGHGNKVYSLKCIVNCLSIYSNVHTELN